MAKLGVANLMNDLRAQVRQTRCRRDFLSRARMRAAYGSEQGLMLLGVGSSCGKPAFALPYALTWTDENVSALEQLANRYFCYVEYGNIAHVRQVGTDKELAAVQDWKPFGVVYMRAEYDHAEELLRDLIVTLRPPAALERERNPR